MQYLQYTQTRMDATRIAVKSFFIALPLAIIITAIAWSIKALPLAVILAMFAWVIGATVGFANLRHRIRAVGYVVKTVFVAAIITALAWGIGTASSFANPYLTLDRARNFALNHVWYDDCRQYTYCYAFPSLAGGTTRIGDSKVKVHVTQWKYNLGGCDGWVWVRTLTDNSLKVYDESAYYIC